MLNNKDEILDTLDTIANDTGKVLSTFFSTRMKLSTFILIMENREIMQKEF